jgi:radical SAM superfamily enzyme YgiQ (UPF0313 family)
MKLVLVNIPAGAYPTDFPPVGISRVIEGLDPGLGCEPFFVNLDGERLSFEKIEEKVRAIKPRVIGLSAILTPTYRYVKQLSLFLKDRFPEIVQVLGGEMAVIAHVILLKTSVDFCVMGESEPAFSHLLARLEKHAFNISDKALFGDIAGLAFLSDNKVVFTGASAKDKPVRGINYALLSRFTSLQRYIYPIPGKHYRERINKNEISSFLSLFERANLPRNMATVLASHGCVGKCTFCHRYYTGYTVIDVSSVIGQLRYLMEHHGVGMILFQEENFGSNTSATEELLRFLKEAKLNWAATAVRVTSLNEERIKSWKEAGCVHINFGIESCSQKMLDVMEKYATVEDNLRALRLCNKYNILTILGLVIGMPGETEETIEETIQNLSTVIPDNIAMPYEICVNYFQAVPGTPGYEYARKTGLIGTSLEEEERYIIELNDRGANDIRQYLNFTDYQKEETAYWKHYIFMELVIAYMRKHGMINILRHRRARRYAYGMVYMLFPKFLRKFILKYLTIIRQFGIRSLVRVIFLKVILDKTSRFSGIDRSLRKVNAESPDTGTVLSIRNET